MGHDASGWTALAFAHASSYHARDQWWSRRKTRHPSDPSVAGDSNGPRIRQLKENSMEDLARRQQQAQKRRKRNASRRGVALLMVLGAITVLTVFLTELQQEVSAGFAAALAD